MSEEHTSAEAGSLYPTTLLARALVLYGLLLPRAEHAGNLLQLTAMFSCDLPRTVEALHYRRMREYAESTVVIVHTFHCI